MQYERFVTGIIISIFGVVNRFHGNYLYFEFPITCCDQASL